MFRLSYYDKFKWIVHKMGTYMPQLSGRVLLNSVMPLQKSSARSFWLHDSTFQFPDFDHVETFIARLVRNGLLMRDRAVEDLLNDQTPPLSVRSMQRRVAHVTRLTLRLVHQIQRAHCTSALLHNGISIADTVHAAGYADQSHMTRSLKRFLGRTPAEIVRQIQA